MTQVADVGAPCDVRSDLDRAVCEQTQPGAAVGFPRTDRINGTLEGVIA